MLACALVTAAIAVAFRGFALLEVGIAGAVFVPVIGAGSIWKRRRWTSPPFSPLAMLIGTLVPIAMGAILLWIVAAASSAV